jgi:hypothetical protein
VTIRSAALSTRTSDEFEVIQIELPLKTGEALHLGEEERHDLILKMELAPYLEGVTAGQKARDMLPTWDTLAQLVRDEGP